MTLSLRPADPSPTDGRAFAALLDVAADGLFGLLLGSRSDAIIAAAFVEGGHDLSYEHVTFAEIDGATAGMVSAYSAGAHATATDDALDAAAGWRKWRMRGVGLLLGGLLDFIDSVPDGDHYLQAIAVDESFRGHGLGTDLFRHVEDLARSQGARRLSLDVATDNHAARRLYERLGMSVASTSPRSIFGSMQVERMTKDL